jgi:hypothetical protein
MKKSPQTKGDDAIRADIPKALYDRVADHCRSKGIAPDEFILEAISEKLSSLYRERRRKPRL